MKVIFRDLNPAVVAAVKAVFPDWDNSVADIFSVGSADIIISPANVIGRMDGGIDQIYINRFGWQLEARLMRDIRNVYGSHLDIGKAHLITTYDERFPLMISAPTMEWPPGDVSRTENAYLAFRAALICAASEGAKALGRDVQTLLVPGMCTLTGRMEPDVFARQLRNAWMEITQGMFEADGRIMNRADYPGLFGSLTQEHVAARRPK